jgi:hypothetical protein
MGSLRTILALLLLATTARAADVAPGLKVGDTLGTDNAAAAKDLLPPEVLKHFEAGEYRNPIVDYALDNTHWEASFDEATKRNATDLEVDDTSTIVSKATGKQPDYVYGIPFPTIDPADPKAATKVIWNQFLAYWNHGNTYNTARVTMLQPKGVDRDIHANGWFKFYDGQSERYRDASNPSNLQSQFLGVSIYPADLNGTSSLTWRYREADKRDSVWAYVPALRRVRAVSPANRSDGYLGSDVSGDDGFFFDGKPQDFTWTFVGKRNALRFVDPKNVSGTLPADPAPGGGWVSVIPNGPLTAGFEDPQWKGISWAPISGALAKRPMYVVKGVPKDRYYLYGAIELWIDAITFDGSYNRKFDWQGDLVASNQSMARVNQPAGSDSQREWVPISTQAWFCTENLKLRRATLSGMRPYPDAPYYTRVPIKPDIFDSSSLVKYGK